MCTHFMDKEGAEELPIARVHLSVSWWSHLVDDLPQQVFVGGLL